MATESRLAQWRRSHPQPRWARDCRPWRRAATRASQERVAEAVRYEQRGDGGRGDRCMADGAVHWSGRRTLATRPERPRDRRGGWLPLAEATQTRCWFRLS